MLRKDPNRQVRSTLIAWLTANLLAWIVIGIAWVKPASAQPPDYFLGRDGTPITVTRGNSPVDHTCNAHVFAQIPGQIDFFLGRARDYAPTGSGYVCEQPHPGVVLQWLTLYKMDWQRHSLSYIKDVLRPPLNLDVPGYSRALLTNAYDPSVIAYNGELWVAFECGALGLHGASACVAPLDSRTYAVNDPRRIIVAVEGGPAPDGYVYSASVPNLFVFNNRVYIYWSIVKIRRGTADFLGVTIHGAELVQEPSGLRRFWVAGSGGRPVPSFHPDFSVRVADINPSDPMSDQSVDLKGLYATGRDIYVAASLGGRGPERTEDCVRPTGRSYGCFRLQLFHTSMPLGNDILNRQPLKAPPLPLNPTGYDRFFIDNQGRLSILGYFFPPHGTYESTRVVPEGMWSFPVNLPGLRF